MKPLSRQPPVSVLVAAAGSWSAMAIAPQAKTAPPGYYRLMLGDFEITSFRTGRFPAVYKLSKNRD